MQPQRWFRRTIGALFATFALILSLALLLVFGPRSELEHRYNREDPNYRYVTTRLGTEIDLQGFNGGDWQFICIIGAYNNPVKVLQDEALKRRIEVTTIDPVKTQPGGISPIEETEGAILFVDRSGRGRTILVDGFERLAAQHDRACFGHDNRLIELPLK